MLQAVTIENFQSHKKSKIEFVPGTNVIIGKSDAGKSAVFRAINWVVSNRPLGDAYRSEWGGDTKVALHTSEGDVVERIKSTNKNEYIVNGKSLKAFGSETPEEVLNILKLDSYNIQTQMDSPFLLSVSPGEAARLLNKAASIDDIDKTISGLRKTQSELTRNVKHDEEALTDYLEQIEQYNNLPEIEEKVRLVEGLEEKRIAKVDNLESLETLTERIRVVEDELAESDHVPELLKRCQDTEQIYSTWKDRARKVQSLKQAISQIERTEEDISRVEKAMQATEQEYHKIAPETCPLCGNKMNVSKAG